MDELKQLIPSGPFVFDLRVERVPDRHGGCGRAGGHRE